MTAVLRGLMASSLLLGAAGAALAQQGSVQVTTAAQAVAGDSRRIAGQDTFEPDLGISWIQPGSRFAVFQADVHATNRQDGLGLGRAFVALRDLKYRGLLWSFEAGDAFFSPTLADYHVTNLATPALTFAGASVTARSPKLTVSMLAGRATAWRNIFGSAAEIFDQDLAVARARRKISDRTELTARASRVRTQDLKEFGFTIAASDQAGAGARFTVIPPVQLIGDASYVAYRKRESDQLKHDGSGLLGVNVLLARGWVQANVSRFSPGDLPVLNQPLADRQTLFAAGEYDVFGRLRAFGGIDRYRTNLAPDPGGVVPENDATRAFGGLRVHVGGRSAVTVRLEDGGRRARYLATSKTTASDTGVWSTEFQTTYGRLTGFARYSRRDNVESTNLDGSFTQQQSSAQTFVNMSRTVQLFGNVAFTRYEARTGAGSSNWQMGGGGQTQLLNRGLWLRAEATTSRNVDLLTQDFVPEESLNVGLNGALAHNTVIGLNVYADRLRPRATNDDSWITRSMLRVTRSFSTGAVRVPGNAAAVSLARASGTGSVIGSVFLDWNADGLLQPEEGPVAGIPVRLGTLGKAATSHDGAFSFLNVPTGLQTVALDLSALPVDFDPPVVTEIQVELSRGRTEHVRFGLVPLGTIHGRVMRDVNGNGQVDGGDVALDGAVLVLDGGARSEQMRKGAFRFDAVRSGEHRVELVADSLPEGGVIVGEPEAVAVLRKDHLSEEIVFLAQVRPRPEVRRVFTPPTGPDTRPAAIKPGTSDTTRANEPRPAGKTVAKPNTAAVGAPADRADQYAIQVAALNDPMRARVLTRELSALGFAAYLVEPTAADPDAPYRVRVGPFSTREDARQVAARLEALRGEKLWVIRQVRER